MSSGARQRVNRSITAVIGALVLVVALAAVIIVPKLAFTASTTSYAAEFGNASGLRVGDPVDIAGVPAGQVTALSLDGNAVRVAFRLDRAQSLGSASTASIKLATILGSRYLAVTPAGSTPLTAGAVIPLARTTPAYSLTDLENQAGSTTDQLDLPALRQLLSTVQQAMPTDPTLVRNALGAVGSAATLLANHNSQLDELLRGAKSVTANLLTQQQTLVSLLGDANLVLSTLDSRRQVINQLISDVGALTTELSQFLADNLPTINTLLPRLHAITTELTGDAQAISDTLTDLAPTSRYLANATGNGPWGDVSGPAGPIPDNLLCVAGLLKGCH